MLGADETFVELCERFGDQQKTGVQMEKRYGRGGVEELGDRSRAPRSHPHVVAPEVVQTHGNGAEEASDLKLLEVMKRHQARIVLAAASTVRELLKKQGLIRRRRRVRQSAPCGSHLGPCDAPNRVRCADPKATLRCTKGGAIP